MRENATKVIDTLSWYQASIVTEESLLEMLSGSDAAPSGWNGVLAIFTDKVEWTVPNGFDAEHMPQLLELRAYTQASELHAVRDVLKTDFAMRVVQDNLQPDNGQRYDAHFDDVQYLDIDSTRSSGFDYVTTGGGSYRLPVENARQIVLRNYIRFGEDDGMARIVDFRIVRLVKGGSDV